MKAVNSNFQYIEGNNAVLLYNCRNGKKTKCSRNVVSIFEHIASDGYTENDMLKEYPELHEKLKQMDLLAGQEKDDDHYYDYDIEKIKKGDLVKMLRLNTTEHCNLNCAYCYEKVTNTFSRKTMEFDVAKKAIDLFRDIIVSTNKAECLFRFFGGEPLINFDLIKRSVEYIEDTFPADIVKQYVVNTNGTLISEEICKFFKDHNFIVIISVDGIGQIHDINRKYKNGEGSFCKIDKSIDMLADVGCAVAFTAVMTDTNYGHLREFIDYVCEKQKHKEFDCKISLNNMQICNRSGIVDKAWDERLELFMDAIRYAKDRDIDLSGGNTFTTFNNMLNGNNGRHCGGNGFELTVSPDGKVFHCGGTQKAFGNVDEGMELFSKPEYIAATMRNPDNIERCKSCPISCFCGGGCMAESMINGEESDIRNEDCKLDRRMFEELVKEFIL